MQNTKIYAGILAGGVGSRMGSTALPKQFLNLGGKPIIIHTIEKFLLCPRFERVYAAVVSDYAEYTKELCQKYIGNHEKLKVIAGGSDRNGSIVNVISELRREDSSPDSILVTHDAVRPFVSAELIDANIDAAIEHGSTDTVIPAYDTVIRSIDGESIAEIPVRDELYHGQTPQSFRVGWFEEDYNSLSDENKSILTDACKIFTLAGRKVRIVMGDPNNLKITTPFDIKMAEAILGSNV